MSNYYITIGRQNGCGGRIIGKKLAEKLGISYYDRDSIIDLVSEDTGLARDAVSELMERRSSSLLYEMAMLSKSNPLEDQVYISQNKIITQLADEGSCVIVGICGNYILRNRENLLKVFLYEDPKQRMERIVNVYNETETMTEQKLKAMDRKRADYYRFFTSEKWGDRASYDININTGLGLDVVTDMLVLIAKAKFGGESVGRE